MLVKLRKNDWLLLFIVCSVSFCIAVFCFYCIGTNKVVLSIDSFAVDENDRVYVGMSDKIYLFENNKQIAVFDSPYSATSSYLKVTADSLILVSGVQIHTMDLDGNVQSVEDDYELANNIKSEVGRASRYFSATGDKYQKKGRLGRLKIVKNNSETVYQISTLSVVVRYAITITYVGFAAFILYFLLTRVPEYAEAHKGELWYEKLFTKKKKSKDCQ